MLIKSIALNNFRQFVGAQKLEFSCDPEKNVTVLLGDNTFGKTTILQAFNWCLYGKVDFPKDSNPNFLLNLEVASDNAGMGKKCEVSVEIVLEHIDLEYTITRVQAYYDRGNNDWDSVVPELSISYKENGLVKFVNNSEQKSVINTILPESLSDYFFFDTERVSDISTRKNLPEAVRGLLGLSAVENARKHLGQRSNKNSVIGQWNSSLDLKGDISAQEAKERIDKEQQSIEENKINIKDAEDQIIALNKEREEIEKVLRDNQSTAELQLKKQELEKEYDEKQKEMIRYSEQFIENFSNQAVTYFMLPLMDRANQCLKNAKVSDKGIRDMTAASLLDIIKRGRCICGSYIMVDEEGKTGNDAYMHILEELKFVPPEHIGSAVQHYKQLLESDKRGVAQFYMNSENLYKSFDACRKRSADIQDEIEKIDKVIFEKEDMSNYENDLNRIKEQLKRQKEKVDRCNREIGASESAIEEARKLYDSLVVTSENNKTYIKYIAYAEKICEWIDETYSKREKDLKDSLERKVNEIFGKMYHGERKVKIDNQYGVTLLTKMPNGRELVSGESEGLKRVKNFAFIAGLVDIAKEKASMGKNQSDSVSWENEPYPLVMDAPFSNADETHIKNISSVLPSVANQVIMFVMQKDWQYAQPVMESRVGKYCQLKKYSESHTEIID